MAQRPQPLTQCPGSPEGISFSTFWYRFPGINDFRICTKCFEDKLAQTQYAKWFECFYHESTFDNRTTCDFNNERCAWLLDDTLKSGDFTIMLDFVKRRATIRSCPGAAGAKPDASVTWFGVTELPEFAVCEACYEDLVLAFPFSENFRPHGIAQGADQVWRCDMTIPFIKRCFVEYSKTLDWGSFLNASRYRLRLSDCTDNSIVAQARTWYAPIAVPNIMICETCFLDEVLLSPGGVAEQFNEFCYSDHGLRAQALCAFSRGSIKQCNRRLLKQDFDRWLQLVSRIHILPDCSKEAASQHYALISPWDASADILNFSICGACHAGFAEVDGFGKLFRPTYPNPTMSAACDLSKHLPRAGKYIDKLTQMAYTVDPSTFIDYVSRVASAPPCCKGAPVGGQYWWGMDEFYFCQECFEEVGRGSYFESSFKHLGSYFSEGQCDMHSDNMRRRYFEACQKQSLAEFTSYCQQQQEILWNSRQASENNAMRRFADPYAVSLDISNPLYAVSTRHNSTSSGFWNPEYGQGHSKQLSMHGLPR